MNSSRYVLYYYDSGRLYKAHSNISHFNSLVELYEWVKKRKNSRFKFTYTYLEKKQMIITEYTAPSESRIIKLFEDINELVKTNINDTIDSNRLL